jgi:beta-barrel assembly-enhancing protease
MKLKLISLAIGLLCIVALGGYLAWQAVPKVLSGVVRLIPASWEERMGKAVVANVGGPGAICGDEDTREMMQKIVRRLEAAMPSTPYRFDVKVVRNPQVNAMAAPGGHIVVFSGLIEKMDNADQLAAVLAHEMQHVVQRHSMKGIVRAVGFQALLSIVLGDPGVLGDLAGNLTVLHFMRSDEESADDGALETLMRAGIPPTAMRRAFENLERGSKDRGIEASFKYLSTHPPLAERIERVAKKSAGWSGAEKGLDLPLGAVCAVR